MELEFQEFQLLLLNFQMLGNVLRKLIKTIDFYGFLIESGPEKRAIRSSATRYDLGKRRKVHSANILNFTLSQSQRLGPSERRAVLSQRSDFAEKQHNLALGRQESMITEQDMVVELR